MLSLLSIFYLITILAGIYFLVRTTFPQRLVERKLEKYPRVSIIVPARNEEQNIGRCLDSLTKLDYPEYEILVVDGNSEDSTREIVGEYDVALVEEPPRPEGWVGKPWACYTGYQQANGEVLLFTDADTVHQPQSLQLLVAELAQSSGFVTFLTTQQFVSFWEHILTIVFLIISVSVRGAKGNKRTQIANGQYMLFTREKYEELGTHKVVWSSIIEDLEFGSIAAAMGTPPSLPSRRHLVTARMYTDLTSIKEGFGKNLALGVQQSGLYSIISTGFLTFWALGWMILLPIEISSETFGPVTLLVYLFGYILFSILLYNVERTITTRATYYVLLYPFYFIVFWVIVSWSMYNTFLRKNVVWKGNQYTL